MMTAYLIRPSPEQNGFCFEVFEARPPAVLITTFGDQLSESPTCVLSYSLGFKVTIQSGSLSSFTLGLLVEILN